MNKDRNEMNNDVIRPHRLGEISIPDDELLIDKKNCRKIRTLWNW